jgi:regulator of replication initiation timing
MDEAPRDVISEIFNLKAEISSLKEDLAYLKAENDRLTVELNCCLEEACSVIPIYFDEE